MQNSRLVIGRLLFAALILALIFLTTDHYLRFLLSQLSAIQTIKFEVLVVHVLDNDHCNFLITHLLIRSHHELVR
jgi:hypothetical protein